MGRIVWLRALCTGFNDAVSWGTVFATWWNLRLAWPVCLDSLRHGMVVIWSTGERQTEACARESRRTMVLWCPCYTWEHWKTGAQSDNSLATVWNSAVWLGVRLNPTRRLSTEQGISFVTPSYRQHKLGAVKYWVLLVKVTGKADGKERPHGAVQTYHVHSLSSTNPHRLHAFIHNFPIT